MNDFEQELTAQPHDAFARDMLSNPANASAFFQSHLPKDIVAAADWSTLTLQPASFVRQNLQQSHTDLLYRVNVAERDMLLYLLFEHQTSVDPLMPLRLLNYVVEVLRQHAETDGLPLPPVLPFVLHQGPDRWTVSTQFRDLFDLPKDLEGLLRPYLPDFHHALLDLTLFDPDKDEHHPLLQVILQLMKAARQKRLIEFFEWLGRSEMEVTLLMQPDLFRRCLLYAVHIDINLDVESISRSLSASPTLQHEAMSLAQKLRQEGRADGLAHGEWAGKIQMLEKFLGVDATTSEVLASLEIAGLEARYVELEQQYNLRFKK